MAAVTPMEPVRLAEQLLAFYDRSGRALPWRGERNLYRIWVSEIMLQQTGVGTVLPYYSRFLERFPDLESLARAAEEEVLLLWQGLGYYQRARHLHRAARQVVAKRSGQLPEQLAEWLALPGIGPSTAAAILAIGRDQPHAILDGNVQRVLARLLALPYPLASSEARQQLWSLARSLTPTQRPGDYAQAIMDLGATVCTRSRPQCPLCPWQTSCRAHALDQTAAFPVVSPRPVKPRRVQVALLLFNAAEALLFCQRPAKGLLGGLWEPPSLEWSSAVAPESLSVAQLFSRELHLHVSPPHPLPVVQHTFTHFHLTVHPFVCQLAGSDAAVAGRWVGRDGWQALPCATLHRKVLARVEHSELVNKSSQAGHLARRERANDET
ncbi:MAG: A/G-specific adenine glycosylase [Magnetococcus sp. YQC-3]